MNAYEGVEVQVQYSLILSLYRRATCRLLFFPQAAGWDFEKVWKLLENRESLQLKLIPLSLSP